MAFYQHAVERVLRKLGIEMVGGMLTAHEKDERARQMAGDTLLDVDTHNPTFQARIRMLLASRVSDAPLAVVLGAEEVAAHQEQRQEHEAKVKAGNPDRDSPALKNGHALTQDFHGMARATRDELMASFANTWNEIATAQKDAVRAVTKRLNNRNKNHPEVCRAINSISADVIEWTDEHMLSKVYKAVEQTMVSLASRLSTFQKNFSTDTLLAYRERTQWVKEQYKQDLRRIRQVQEKLFKQARALQAKVDASDAKGRETPMSDSSGVGFTRVAHCATKDDHVARLAQEGSGLIKELSADLSRLQAEMAELKKKMQRERAARQAAEAAAREAKAMLRERDELLAELRKKYAEVEADLAAREAALKAAQELADELKRKWQEAQDDIMNKLKVINVLKSKNRKLDGQRLAEKKSLQARLRTAMHRKAGDDEGNQGDKSRRAKATPRQRVALKGEDLSYDGPAAMVAEVDCHCTCGAALDEGKEGKDGEGDGGDGGAPVTHAEDCALFMGLTAPIVLPAPLRTATSTLHLATTSVMSDDEYAEVVTDPDMLDLSTGQPRHARSRYRRTPSMSHPRIAGRGMVLRSADSATRGVSLHGFAGVQQGVMHGERQLPVELDEGSIGPNGSMLDAGGVATTPAARQPFPKREPAHAGDGYRWSPGGAGLNSYRSWTMRHHARFMRVGGPGSPLAASRVALPHPLVHQGNASIHQAKQVSTDKLLCSTSLLEASTFSPAPRAGSAHPPKHQPPVDMTGDAASVAGFAPSPLAMPSPMPHSARMRATSFASSTRARAASAGVDGRDGGNDGFEEAGEDVFGDADDADANTVAALAAAYERRVAGQRASPTPGSATPLLSDNRGISFFDLRAAGQQGSLASPGMYMGSTDAGPGTPHQSFLQPPSPQPGQQSPPSHPPRPESAQVRSSMHRARSGPLRSGTIRPQSASPAVSRTRRRIVAAREAGGSGGTPGNVTPVTASRRGHGIQLASTPVALAKRRSVGGGGSRMRLRSDSSAPILSGPRSSTTTASAGRLRPATARSFVTTPEPGPATRGGSPSPGPRGSGDETAAPPAHLVNWERVGHEADGKSHIVHTGFSPKPSKPVLKASPMPTKLSHSSTGRPSSASSRRPASASRKGVLRAGHLRSALPASPVQPQALTMSGVGGRATTVKPARGRGAMKPRRSSDEAATMNFSSAAALHKREQRVSSASEGAAVGGSGGGDGLPSRRPRAMSAATRALPTTVEAANTGGSADARESGSHAPQPVGRERAATAPTSPNVHSASTRSMLKPW